MWKLFLVFRFSWRSNDERGLLRCNAVYFGDRPTFRSKVSPSSGPKNLAKQENNRSCKLLSRVDYSSTLKMEAIYSFETFVSQLHGVTPQKILLFIW
jgi:hypothetical protein